MSRYIDANKKLTITVYDDEHEEHVDHYMTIEEILDTYTSEGCPPTADVVERKRGEWIETSSGDHWKCSRCNYRAGFWFDEENSCEWSMDVSEWLSNFCPNCGTDMRGDEDDKG